MLRLGHLNAQLVAHDAIADVELARHYIQMLSLLALQIKIAAKVGMRSQTDGIRVT